MHKRACVRRVCQILTQHISRGTRALQAEDSHDDINVTNDTLGEDSHDDTNDTSYTLGE